MGADGTLVSFKTLEDYIYIYIILRKTFGRQRSLGRYRRRWKGLEYQAVD
jgi:hypothetical protein